MFEKLRKSIRQEKQMVCILLNDGDFMWAPKTMAFPELPVLATGVMYKNHPFSEWELDEDTITVLDTRYNS